MLLFSAEVCDGMPWGPIENGELTECFLKVIIVSLIPSAFLLVFGTHALCRHIFWRRTRLDPRSYLPVLDADTTGSDAAAADAEQAGEPTSTRRAEALWTALLNLCLVQLVLVVGRVVAGLREDPRYVDRLLTFERLEIAVTVGQWAYVLAVLSYLVYVKCPQNRPSLSAPCEKHKRESLRFLLAFCLVDILCKCVQLASIWISYGRDETRALPLLFVAAQVGVALLFLAIGVVVAANQELHFRRRRRLSPQFVPEAHPIPFSKEKGASLFSRLTFSWFNDLIETGYHKTLDLADVPDLLQEDKAETVCARFDTIRPHHASLLASLYHLVRTEFLTQTAYAFVSAVLSFSGPFFLNRILNHVSQPKGTAAPLEGLAYATALLVCSVVRAVCDGQVFFTGRRIGTRVRAVVIGQVYAKALRRRATAPDADDETASATTGQITNLMAVDTAKILEVSCYLIYFWAYPLQIVICTTLLVVVLGWPALAGIAVMVAVLPVGGYLGKMVADKQKALIKATDARITAMNETLQGIRIIKFFAWENHYFAMLTAFRKTELVRLKAYLYTTAASRLVWYAAPILVSFLTFLTFTRLAGRDLTAEIAFTGLALFNALREPLKNFPDMIVRYTEAHVSLTRVQRFLDEEELERYGENKTPAPAGAPACTGGGDGGGGRWSTASSGDATTAPVPAVGFKGPAAFSWLAKTDKGTGRKTFTLDNLTVAFPPAKLSLICGVTGAGKTSMIYALLGEMNRTAGESHLLASDPQTGLSSTTSVAFAAQQSWLMNATIRDNILFGLPYEHAKYTRVIAACALVRDLDTLPGGDMTEIGEKGVNVSGGQKARISLARAAYSEAPTVLLDDPLSAVDAPTARHVFEHCVLGLMANRTRVLVTHAVHLCVPHADHVVVMKRGGVAAQGPPSEVVGKGPGKIDLDAVEDGEEEDEDNEGEQPVTATMASGEHELGPVQEVAESGANATDSSSSVASSRSPSPDIESDISVEVDMESTDDSLGLETDGRAGDHRLVVRLTEDETRARGAVKSEVYWSYIRASGGLVFALALAMAYASVQLAAIGQDWWLKHWAQAYQRVAAAAVGYWITPLVMVQGGDEIPEVSDGGQHPPPQAVDVDYYLTIYAAIGAVSLLALLIRIVVVYSGSLRASRRLHDTMLRKLLCAPMRFFDTTPMGRILNRFSRDIQCLDQEVASYSGEFLANAVAAVAIVVVVAAVTPVFVGGLIPIALVYLSVARRYLRTSTELKRLDSITRSPIYSHFGETIVGAPTIRAYGAVRRFMRESNARVDMNHRAFFYLWVSNRWLGVRVDFVGACVSFTAAVAILVSIHWGKGMDPGAAGLSLSYALTFTDALLWVVRMHAVMEMSMNSVERISEYLTIDQEAPAESTPRDRPPFDWPASGRVEFRNVTARYAPDLVPVLDNVSFTAQAGEKVGIVGRTGAGKSTLSLALFRFLEASAGHIFVDGVDVATVGLRDLRSRLTIIPQDPVLFTGTVRSNLDPFGQHSDLELWTALRRAHLAESSTARLSRNPSSHAVVSSPVSIGKRASTEPARLSASPATSMATSSLVLDKTGSLVARSIPTSSAYATPTPSRRPSATFTSSAAAAEFFAGVGGGGDVPPPPRKRKASMTPVLGFPPVDPIAASASSRRRASGASHHSSHSHSHTHHHHHHHHHHQQHQQQQQQQQQITLDTLVQEGGQNFSQGQRQLLCLARALLRSCKVIVLDEATASVDHETDAKIQETIRTEFRGATLLCVAHRLRTVADYDKILVLSRGQVAEFGTPSDLLAKDSSDSSAVFRQMCQESGEMGHLKEIARTADVARAVKRRRSLM
ncbi:hypothetical protein PhCBS80983_g03764 [Powellomyces hirtus]|uniref:P-loop containing nucleoside triphosphate hydrolase protein n=1 Tax=Powellomyces hirtus TaxID=109895 RepID=A0A507E362_9FUNG|nr:hypothetical protein PhCBS80983_g03764 [Powellomyces hirtus]